MRVFLTVILSALTCGVYAADQDIAGTRDRQADVKSDTEQLARRVGTMLRVLDHYKLDQAAEAKLLDEAASTLRGLSRVQMADVLAKLDDAMKTADADAKEKNIDAAYTGHREALTKLKGLLGHYDSIRDLNTAIARLERLANEEVELSFRVADILQDSLDTTNADVARRRRALRSDFPTTRARREAEEQGDYFKELAVVLRQFEALRPNLRPDETGRMDQALRVFVSKNMLQLVKDITNRIRPEGTPENRHKDWAQAIDGIWSVAGQLQETAEILRTPRDKLIVLREARTKLAVLIEQLQQEAHAGVEFFSNPPDAVPEQPGGLGFRMKNQPPEDPIAGRSRILADAEGRLAHQSRAVQYGIATFAPPVAADIERGGKALISAGQSFRQTAPLYARMFQAWGESQWRQALSGLDAAISQAEKERSDVLVATQSAAERIDQLIREQKQLKHDTDRFADTNNDDAAKRQAAQQKELANQAADVAQMPLPTNQKTKDLLKDATQSMEAASKDLNQGQPKPASEKQDEAIAKLEKAKQELDAKAKEIAQRRDEMAKLENAKQKLEELSRAEQEISEAAKKSGEDAKISNEKLAEQQDKLTSQTKDLTQELKQPVPEAAKATESAAEAMEQAKSELQKKKPDDAAMKADQAAADLEKAAQAVDQELAEKLAKEAADQARLNPDQIDALQAARELVKAMDATKEAQRFSEQAQQSPLMKHLVERQEKLANQAKEMGQDKAAEPAKNAADRLQKGDLKDAVNQQDQALKQMQQAFEKSGDLAKADLSVEQLALLQTTLDLAKSLEATQMAQEALQQAKAQAPPVMQQQLDQAGKQLDQAGQQLQQGQAQQARQSQQKADESLQQALQALQEAANMNPPPQNAQRRPGDNEPGDEPGQQQNNQRQQNPERDDQIASGDRQPDGSARNPKAQLNNVEGDGSFLHLPPRQRELIRQAMADKLPPDYATLIQQYYVNVAKGKPAAKQGTEPPRP